MKSTAATDLDRLVELGYDRDESRRALQTTRGDLREAKSILNGKASEQDNVNAWRQEIKGDFEAGIDCSAGNLDRAENRALVKTPLYCSVGEPRVRDGVTFYAVNAICKTGNKVVRMRRYSSFSELKTRLPLGTCSSFKSTFPPAIPSLIGDVVSIFGGETATETRRAALDDWLREFSLNEEIMTNQGGTSAIARQLLYTFLAIDPDTHAIMEEREDLWASGATANPFAMTVSVSPATTTETTTADSLSVEPLRVSSASRGSNTHSPDLPSKYMAQAGPLTFATDAEKAGATLVSLNKVSSLDPTPCPLGLLIDQLPFKTPVSSTATQVLAEKEQQETQRRRSSMGPFDEENEKVGLPLPSSPLHQGSNKVKDKDKSREQLVKDFKRDRLIINKVRVSGSDTSIEQMMAILQDEINAVLMNHRKPPLRKNSEINRHFCEDLLQRVSRTESAYLSHLTFSEILKQQEEQPVAIVPVSDLAEPLRMVVSLKVRDAAASMKDGSVKDDFAVQVELQAGTVFRVNDPLSDNLDTLCQVKCHYKRTVFGMVTVPSGSGSCELRPKAGKAWVLFTKCLKTMREDWRK